MGQDNEKCLLLPKLCREGGVELLVLFTDFLHVADNRNEATVDHLLHRCAISTKF